MGYASGELLSAAPFTSMADQAVTTAGQHSDSDHAPWMILLGGNSEGRTRIARTFMDKGWRVAPVDSYDDVDPSLYPNSIVACKIETSQDVAAIARKMEQQGIWLPVIACVEQSDHTLITAAIQSGAQAILSWPFGPDDLEKVLAIASGGMARHAAQRNARSAARSRLASLTKRERDVLFAMIALGSNKAVANALKLSPRTVEIYRAKTMQRLGAEHLAHAVWFAYTADQGSSDHD